MFLLFRDTFLIDFSNTIILNTTVNHIISAEVFDDSFFIF